MKRCVFAHCLPENVPLTSIKQHLTGLLHLQLGL